MFLLIVDVGTFRFVKIQAYDWLDRIALHITLLQ